MIKLLLVDLDDTLCDSESAYNKAKKESWLYFNKNCQPISFTHFLKLYDKAKADIHEQLGRTASSHNRFLYFQKMLELLHLPPDPDHLNRLTKIFWLTTNKHLKLYPSVESTLKKIKDTGLKIALVTDLLANIQIEKMKTLKIGKYVDFLVSSEEAGKEKPAPQIFELALKKAGCLPHETIMIGDSCERDIVGANRVGIISVLFGSKQCPEAKYRIAKFSDILAIIDKLNPVDKSEGEYVKFKYDWQKKTLKQGKKSSELMKFRQNLYKNKLIGALPSGIGFGNLSIRTFDNKFIITGTKSGRKKKISINDLSEVLSVDYKKNKLVCVGNILASSESLSHAAIYESDPSVKAVIHIHNLSMWRKMLNILPTTNMKATYGTEFMAKEIKKLFKKKSFKKENLIVMAGHVGGIIVFGKTLNEAYKIIIKNK